MGQQPTNMPTVECSQRVGTWGWGIELGCAGQMGLGQEGPHCHKARFVVDPTGNTKFKSVTLGPKTVTQIHCLLLGQ